MALALKTKTKTRLDTQDLEGGDIVAIIDTTMELEEIAEYMDNSQLVLNSSDEIVLDIDQSALPDTIDKIVGTLQTEFSKGHVASLLRCGMLQLADCDDLPPSKKKRSKQPAKSKSDVATKPTAPATETTEDDLDEDLDEDEPQSQVVPARSASEGSAPEAAKTPEPFTIDPSLSGIPIRIQQVLTASNLGTKAAIESYVAEGKKLIDVDGIGPRTEMHLTAWLSGQPWPDK